VWVNAGQDSPVRCIQLAGVRDGTLRPPWMDAWCGVFDHPYFAVTSKDGVWSIKDLPPGDYTIEAWHEVYGTKEAKVTVTPGETATLAFELEPPARKD